MAFPLKTEYKAGQGLCQIKASDLETIGNMLNGIQVEMVRNQDYAEVIPPNQKGVGWKLKIPILGTGEILPEGGSDGQVLQRDSEGDAIWDWVRAHA